MFVTGFAKEIWEKKYAGDYSDPKKYYHDLAKRLSLGDQRFEDAVYDMLIDGRFSPGGRVLAFSGRPTANQSLMNCTTHKVEEDSLESISQAMCAIMRASSHGQGIGIDLSELRPNDSPVNNAAKTSSGAISFMELLNHVGETVGQNGRRAAMLFSLADDHPDIWRDSKDVACPNCNGNGCQTCNGIGYFPYDFLHVKSIPGHVEGANISVRISDAFMKAVKNNWPWELHFDGESASEPFSVARTVNARELFHEIAKCAWRSAEPGVLFFDTIKRMSNSDLVGFPVVGCNACLKGDTKITTSEGYITIADLAELPEAKYPDVLTFAEGTCSLEYEKPEWIGLTREAATVIELELEDGRTITLTPDHKVLVQDKGWIAAGKLTEDDILLTI